MTVNEIAELASELTGGQVGVGCVQRAAGEIAAEYRPIVRREQTECTGQIGYDALTYYPIRIYAVYSCGRPVEFRTFFDRLEADVYGAVEIEYAYVPDFQETDECPFDGRTVAYGAAAEYCLKNSLFEESAAWDTKFRDSLARQAPVGGSVRRRRWL